MLSMYLPDFSEDQYLENSGFYINVCGCIEESALRNELINGTFLCRNIFLFSVADYRYSSRNSLFYDKI